MAAPAARLFVPGWGASPGLYARGLPEGWRALEPPDFRSTGGELAAYRSWIVRTVEREGPVTLAGHSMGGALAVLAAAARPELVQRLVLISPAGLPLQKPLLASAATFAGQVARRCYPLRELVPDVAAVLRAPRSALRLAQTVRGLDLSPELEAVRAARIPTAVIACGTDTLVTPAHCRALAERLGGTYRTVRHEDGHIWMLRGWQRLAQELAGGA